MIQKAKKKFRLIDAVLASVCIVLVVESVVPTAAIGVMQYFWWGLLFLAFFLPYGLISAELGSAYQGEGGLFDWVKRGLGIRSGARVAWYYWVNFPLWIASLAALFTVIYSTFSGYTFDPRWELAVQLVFIWLVIWLSSRRITESKWVINFGAIIKALIIIAIGALGIWGLINHGMAKTTLNTFDSTLTGLSFISIIIFNFLGFEVMSAFSGDMKNPKKQIPKAIVIGGILIAAFYMLGAFGVSAAIPVDKLSLDSGLLDAFSILAGGAQWVLVVVGILFMYTMISNLVSWSPGVNYVAQYAAKNKALPKVFASVNKHGVPLGANLINGLVASALVVAAYYIVKGGGNVDTFWTFFALNVVTFIASYILLFPAFLRLRQKDPKKERPFKVKGGKVVIVLASIVPLVLLVAALIFTLFPYDSATNSFMPSSDSEQWWLIYGAIAAIVAGEILGQVAVMRNKKGKRVKA
jgi:glutamate:GABA antiporter